MPLHCIVCEQPFGSDEIPTTIAEGVIHLECFRCQTCARKVTLESYLFSDRILCFSCARCALCGQQLDLDCKNKELVCNNCFQCCSCGQPIVLSGNNYVFINNTFFCMHCSKCSSCGQDLLRKENIGTANNKIYCEACSLFSLAETCNKCQKPIIGEPVFRAMESAWHSGCFRCTKCETHLVKMNFIKRNNMPYCKACINEMNIASKQENKCKKCGLFVQADERIIISDQVFHAFHFLCATCNQPLTSHSKEYDGKQYCENDFKLLSRKTCAACNKPIDGQVSVGLGETYHMECFVCFKCGSPFQGGSHYEHDGKAYCKLHYNEILGIYCSFCFQGVTEKAINALGRKWCSDHLRCFGCHLLLSSASRGLLDVDGKPMCRECFHALPHKTKMNLHKFKSIQDEFEKGRKGANGALNSAQNEDIFNEN